MAHNITNTYSHAKNVFQNLALKEDLVLDIPVERLNIFRKHLCEMVKRQKSSNKYTTRIINNQIKVIRIN